MKTLKTIFSGAILIFALNSSAQVKWNGTNLGIGIDPSYKLDVNGGFSRFKYGSNKPMLIDVYHSDPRICSNYRVVFYKYQSPWDYIDIQCKIAHEYSDSLAKTNFQRVEKSIDKLKKITGYTYNWKTDVTGPRHAGLLAQQVERVMPEAVTTNDSTGQKLLAYSNITPYLVEAIKELSAQVEYLENKINEKEMGQLKNADAESPLNGSDLSETKSILYQNIPNPFNAATNINFYLAEEISSAYVNIYNLQGLQIKSYKINQRGNGSVNINGSELAPGRYLYSLIADGQEIDTKKMVLTSE